MEAAIQITEGRKFDVELSKICFKLEFVANALENEDNPAGEILNGITKELDTLVDQVIGVLAKQ
ncbi:MAG: hypothetical protein KUA37_07180 [Desulfomicrobium sp.]|nr:hypothetical protein [Pseudomonadota bacterium]MBV1711774.1 hypothetical protein [Desulfomicrobium sp.]MBU4572638.1 hypothetical protein [Pseudomonadota bacterium]MBU4593581.1 hypothetical protein [Pseudomonadota bacterium]MBV1719164.1 hypothetical protein [Desulfomicrobium sp.]